MAKKAKKGQTMVEYILIVSLIAIALIAVVKSFSGKVHDKFQEAKELIAAGGGYPINGSDDFAKIMDSFIADKASLATSSQKAGEYVKSASGATDKVLDAINL